MKRFLLAVSIMALSCPVFAISNVFLSSNTATADTTKSLCASTVPGMFASTNHAVVHNACVNTGTAGTLTLYNSNGTAIQPFAAIDTAAKGCQNFDVILSSGITYTNSATANITITYQCY